MYMAPYQKGHSNLLLGWEGQMGYLHLNAVPVVAHRPVASVARAGTLSVKKNQLLARVFIGTGVAGRWYQQLTGVECEPYDLRQLRQLLFFQSILQHF